MANEEHLLKLTWYMERGSQGTDNDPDNPLSRAVNRLFEDGKPFQRIALCFLGDLAPHVSGSTPVRWLGVFTLSAAGQVIFFPGFAAPPTKVESFRGQPLRPLHNDQAFQLDHLSLEKDRTQFHLTEPKSKGHLHTPAGTGIQRWPTYPLGDGRVLWCGMSVAHETALRELKAETLVISDAPPSHSRQRSDWFLQAREGAEFLWVSLHPEARGHFQEGFLHFAFIVGPQEFPPYEGNQLGFPFGSPDLSKPLLPDVLENLPVHHHRLSLGSSIDIQIVTMWLPGTLRVPFSLNGATS
jgi:hypothetical protein